MTNSLFVQTLKKKQSDRVPFWYMRQAGRYLPEYKEVRKNAGSFLDLCYNPELACEVTLQPIRRFDMSAAIIFSDILVIPDALGADVKFVEGEGPRIAPIQNESGLKLLDLNGGQEKLDKVYAALKLTRAGLAPDKALIGFAGAPWTVACYMVSGGGKKDFSEVKKIAHASPEFFAQLIELLVQATIKHLSGQVKAGANVLQLFESHGGELDGEEFKTWSIAPTQKIISAIKKLHPEIPIIGFPRNAGEKIAYYVEKTGVDGVSLDYNMSLDAGKKLQEKTVIQGNLHPDLLLGDKDKMLDRAKRIVEAWGEKPFIFNLGHGVSQFTPPENVAALSEYLLSVRI